jgi:hypothetical protein
MVEVRSFEAKKVEGRKVGCPSQLLVMKTTVAAVMKVRGVVMPVQPQRSQPRG